MKGLKRMFGGMQGGEQALPSPTNPYGLPEVSGGKQVPPKKLSPKDKKKKRKAEKRSTQEVEEALVYSVGQAHPAFHNNRLENLSYQACPHGGES